MTKVIKERGGDVKARRKRWTEKAINNLKKAGRKYKELGK
jgi:hypothetical protein